MINLCPLWIILKEMHVILTLKVELCKLKTVYKNQYLLTKCIMQITILNAMVYKNNKRQFQMSKEV